MSLFFNWAVERERKHVANILCNQPAYHTDHKNVYVHIEYWTMDTKDPSRCVHIYEPEESNGCSIVNIHGGGLIAGNVMQNHNFCMFLAEQGFTVYALEYRLIPGVTFANQVEDICSGLRWVCGRLHNTKNFLVADSAGCLLALFGLTFYGELFYGAWFNSPMFEVHPLMRRGTLGKKWRASIQGAGLEDPYSYFKYVVPRKVWITHTVNDSTKKQAFKAAKMWKDVRYEVFDHGDHDYNVINAHEYECQVFNKMILDWMLEV